MSVTDTSIAFSSRAGNNYVAGTIVNLPDASSKIVAHVIQRQSNGMIE